MPKRALFCGLLFGASVTMACTGLLGLEPVQFDEITDAAPETSTETGADGGAEDASPISHCQDEAGHDFCDDFEGVATADERWTNVELGANGKVGFADFADGGHGARMQVETNITTAVPIARLTMKAPWPRTATGGQHKVFAGFDMWLEQIDTARTMQVWDVITGREDSDGFEDAVSLLVDCGEAGTVCSLNVIEGYRTEAGAIVTPVAPLVGLYVPVQTWVHLEIRLNERPEATEGGGVVVTLTTNNGSKSGSYGLQTSARVPYFRTDFGLSNGTSTGGTYVVFYDNVQLDWLK